MMHPKSYHPDLEQLILQSEGFPVIMGIVNVTPDSFSDGNQHFKTEQAIQHGLQLIEQGASILDIGGESTRPGAEEVSLEDELKRVIPVVKGIREQTSITISVDTYKAEVARQAIQAGANIINDISALRFDPEMVEVLTDFPDSMIVLMHMQGTPRNMQTNPTYEDPVKEVLAFLQERIEYCVSCGIDKSRIIIDPGIGFGKRLEDNLLLHRSLVEFHRLGVAVLLGTSRKSFINMIDPSPVSERLAGTLASSWIAAKAMIEIIRVHDVKEHRQFFAVTKAVFQER